MTIRLNILPFGGLEVHEDDVNEMKKFLIVEKKVESEIEGSGMKNKVSPEDLRILIFLGILTRKKGFQNSSQFKESFFENAKWLVKKSTLKKFKEGVLKTNMCENLRLVWKEMFFKEDFRANFGEILDKDTKMTSQKKA